MIETERQSFVDDAGIKNANLRKACIKSLLFFDVLYYKLN